MPDLPTEASLASSGIGDLGWIPAFAVMTDAPQLAAGSVTGCGIMPPMFREFGEKERSSARRKIPRAALAVLAGNFLLLSACTPASADITTRPGLERLIPDPYSLSYADTDRFAPEKRLATYDVTLPPDLNRDMSKAIWFALQNGGAKELSRGDFSSCEVLVDGNFVAKENQGDKFIPRVFRRKLTEWINSVLDNYAGILCRTRGRTGDEQLDRRNRNTVIFRGGEPYLFFNPTKGPGIWELEAQTGRDIAVELFLSFDPDPNGEVVLPDGSRLNVVSETPHIYAIHTTPRNMEMDLPEEK